MAVDPLGRLLQLRKIRVDSAVADLAQLRNELTLAKTELAAARQHQHQMIQFYQSILGSLPSEAARTLGQLAAVHGDLEAARQNIQQSNTNIDIIEMNIDNIDKRIATAHIRWKVQERAHDRCLELRIEVKKRGLLKSLAAEEFSEG